MLWYKTIHPDFKFGTGAAEYPRNCRGYYKTGVLPGFATKARMKRSLSQNLTLQFRLVYILPIQASQDRKNSAGTLSF